MFDEDFFVNHFAKMFSRFFKKREQFTDSVMAFHKTKSDFLKIAIRFNGYHVFFPQRKLTNSERCVRKQSFITIIYWR